MKKLFAILLAVMLFASMATVVSAAENTTTLTTEVPAAAYTLNVPAVVPIDFGATETDSGSITVTGASGFAAGKDLKVTLTYDAFTSDGVSTEIPFTIRMQDSTYDYSGVNSEAYIDVASGESLIFKGQTNGSVMEFVKKTNSAPNGPYTLAFDDTMVRIASADWGKALAGEYTATITFTAEVVVE